jgi:Protein of unknown function (DUF1566)
MRRNYFLAPLAVLLLVFGLLVSCGGDDDDNDNDSDEDVSGDTWADTAFGLTWQAGPPSDLFTWADAKSYCEDLSLDGGGWHLPTISELRTLICGCDGTESSGSCGITESCSNSFCGDESCHICEDCEGAALGCHWPADMVGKCDWNWSSTPVGDLAHHAWEVNFRLGYILNNPTDDAGLVRCVR